MRARIDTHSDKTVRVTPLKTSDVRLLIAMVVLASPKVPQQWLRRFAVRLITYRQPQG